MCKTYYAEIAILGGNKITVEFATKIQRDEFLKQHDYCNAIDKKDITTSVMMIAEFNYYYQNN